MKIKKIYEESSYEEELQLRISDLIRSEIIIESVPYSDGDQQISYESIERAAKAIIEELKEDGLVEFLKYKKYNL